ncbi:alpha/beta hydrolase [Myxococcota bacterium]|nr:alpha/beta hydrolase [Myxococcota bacterium]
MSTSSIARAAGHVVVRGLPLAYHTWGDRSRPPLVLVHGFQDHAQSWSRVAKRLWDRWFVVAVDLRGHGESGWVGAGGDYHFYDYLHDLLSVVDHLELARFGLVGHSLGGNVTVFATAMAPERVSALVLLEGLGFQTHALTDTLGRLRRWHTSLRRGGIALDVEGRRATRQKLTDVADAAERLRRYNERLEPAHALELAETFTEPFEDGVAWRFDPLHKVPAAKPYLFDEVAAAWRGLSMPVLSLYGDETSWVPSDLDARIALVPDLRSGVVERAGHNLHHDRPEVIADAIARWMTDPTAPLPAGIREGRPPPT